MDITIEAVKKEEKQILINLWEKYFYELSQYTNILEIDDFGLYYNGFYEYFSQKQNCFLFFIKVDGNLAGFVIVDDSPETNFDQDDKLLEMDYRFSDFFVMHKYRRLGIGKYVVKYILDKFKGKWQLGYIPGNKISKEFWTKVINEYTMGKYKLIENGAMFKFNSEPRNDVFLFET